MALVPLSGHIFFLGQLQTFYYLLVYFAVLGLRFRSGVVTRQMVRLPFMMPGTFVAIGAVEALASLLGFLGAANLPGVVLPLLAQTILLWQVLLAVTVLRKRLSVSQVLGVGLVMGGVCLAAWPQGGGSPLDGINPMYAAIFVVSMLFPALDTLLKERVFRLARVKLGTDLDLFVCNSFGSLSQCVFVFLLLPAMTAIRGMSMRDLPGYLAEGWQCFRGITPSCGGDCSLSPALPVAYILCNLAFNVSALELIKSAGNVVMSLTMSAIVPLTILAFATNLPFLPPAPPLGPCFLLGTVGLFAGLLLFNAALWIPTVVQAVKSWAANAGDGSGGAQLAANTKQ